MRIRSKYWLVPLLAALGVLFAFLHSLVGSMPSGDELAATVAEEQPAAPETTIAEPTPPPRPEPAAPAAAPVTPPRYSEEEIKRIRGQIKVIAASVFATEKSFRAEFGRYTTDLEALGWFPESEELHAKAGFLVPFYPRDPGEAGDTPLKLSTDELLRSDFLRSSRHAARDPFRYAKGVESLRLADAGGFCRMGCTADEDRFELVIIANLDNDPELEVWTINESKEILQARDDLGN